MMVETIGDANMYQTQPTYAQLRGAFNNCCLAFAFGHQAEALEKLKALREAKTTWIGAEENSFRVELDRYLREHV